LSTKVDGQGGRGVETARCFNPSPLVRTDLRNDLLTKRFSKHLKFFATKTSDARICRTVLCPQWTNSFPDCWRLLWRAP